MRGHHTYKEVWTPVTGEVLTCARETVNLHDHFAVKGLRAGVIVGHLPKKISTICSLFLSKGGTISCQVSGNRRYSSDLIQGGLEVPCILKLEGDECLMLKTKKLLAFLRRLLKLMGDQSKQIQTNPNKKIKLEEGIDVDSNSSKAVWVTFDKLTLNLSDKVTIEEGSWLSDMHIEFAQRLLRSQFTSIEVWTMFKKLT